MTTAQEALLKIRDFPSRANDPHSAIGEAAAMRRIANEALAALSQQAAQEPQSIDRDRIMELAEDFGVESLRLGSYEARDLNWKALMIRDKREAAREKLRQALYAAAPAKPAEQEKAQQESQAITHEDGNGS